ncbi:uncharacterized protein LOC105388269 isoform X2 [Plutella xylostella]|uniref:uncharacterized protein LOC105388269 isoform X2 n=1 Tax=Plutella xylostella TaxID=51655 RepID=UPI0005D0C171|nr:uncharacterized protein LOC105388269 isoform X2 [Plutella xylostella]
MGADSDILAAIANGILFLETSAGLSRFEEKNWTHPGVHANFLFHSVLGVLYHSKILDVDFTSGYAISIKATRYLALPCLMADLYSNKKEIATIHLVSGVVPFVLALSGHDNPHLGNVVVAGNILSLCYYSYERERPWGWYTAGVGYLTYFTVFTALTPDTAKIAYPLGLTVLGHCINRMFMNIIIL